MLFYPSDMTCVKYNQAEMEQRQCRLFMEKFGKSDHTAYKTQTIPLRDINERNTIKFNFPGRCQCEISEIFGTYV